MKKYLPHILIGLVGIAVIFLFLTAENNTDRQFDGRITLRTTDKVPYGTYVAFQSLRELFPSATVKVTRQEQGYWDTLANFNGRQALVIVTSHFFAGEFEMKKLLQFIENGNDVFISTMTLSEEAGEMLDCRANSPDGLMYYFEQSEGTDLLSVSLAQPPFFKKKPYTYPGKRYDFYFFDTDTATTTILGYDKNNNPNFIHLKAGNGNLFVHLAPLALSNYFLLHRNNISYLENVFSVLSPDTKRILWDEYFKSKPVPSQKKQNWLSVFFQYPSLKWALFTALLALLLYVLSEMRRKQRMIPVISKPKNDSLEFVKTIGRLYHDKGDHKNLCRKMSGYFLEHVRSRYKLSTSVLNDDFIQSLHGKTGADTAELTGIVSFIRNLDAREGISERELAWFHKQLETFYKTA